MQSLRLPIKELFVPIIQRLKRQQREKWTVFKFHEVTENRGLGAQFLDFLETFYPICKTIIINMLSPEKKNALSEGTQ